MKVSLISIGNSKGVRLPASVIKECGFGSEIEMRVEDGVVMLAPQVSTRAGWESAFETMAAAGDDAPLLPETLGNSFDADDWQW